MPTNGIRLSVLDQGAPGLEAVLLLHGFPEGRFGWRHQLAPLQQHGLRTIVPSLRGYDESDKPRGVERYRLDEIVRDVTGCLDALVAPARPVFVVGHDWGGIVAWRLAATDRRRVRKLVVLNAPILEVWLRAMRTSLRQRLKSWYVQSFRIPWLPETVAGLFDGWLLATALRWSGRTDAFSEKDIEVYRDAWSRPEALRAMIDWYRAIPSARKNDMPSISVPTLLLWGKKDVALTEELATESIARCKQGTLLFFPKATHWLQHDEPKAVNRLILGFLHEEDPAAMARAIGPTVVHHL